MLKIGTNVLKSGYTGTVIANEKESRYGYCPNNSSIVRMWSGSRFVGDTIVANSELTIDA